MELDHLIPEALGGLTEEENLWLAMLSVQRSQGRSHCRPGSRDGSDRAPVQSAPPDLAEHFEWSDSGDQIIGLTPIGRATVLALNVNRPSLVKARQAWVSVGWHPPKE
jgi:hypothetical protein